MCNAYIYAILYLYYYESITTCNNFIFYRYIDDIIVFYLNNNFLDLHVNYQDNLNFSENCLVSNAITFLDLKIIFNSSKSFDIDLHL